MRTRSRLGSGLALLVSLFALGFAGCGSSDEAPKSGGKPDAGHGGEGGQGPDGGEGGSGGGGGEPAYTLDEVCDVLAEKECAAVEACCDSSGVGYDEAGCQGAIKTSCEAQVAKAKEGKLVFDSESVDPCADAMAALYGKCELSWEETGDVLLGLPACRGLFAGTKSAGESCATVEDCKPPTEASQVATCESQKCVVRPKFRAEGDPCTIGATVGCAIDLYCDADPKQQGAFGKCQKVKALGAACDKSQEAFAQFECGIGNHCHQQLSTCTKGKAAGEACTDARAYECESYTCRSGQCAPLSVANEGICKGGEGGA